MLLNEMSTISNNEIDFEFYSLIFLPKEKSQSFLNRVLEVTLSRTRKNNNGLPNLQDVVFLKTYLFEKCNLTHRDDEENKGLLNNFDICSKIVSEDQNALQSNNDSCISNDVLKDILQNLCIPILLQSSEHFNDVNNTKCEDFDAVINNLCNILTIVLKVLGKTSENYFRDVSCQLAIEFVNYLQSCGEKCEDLNINKMYVHHIFKILTCFLDSARDMPCDFSPKSWIRPLWDALQSVLCNCDESLAAHFFMYLFPKLLAAVKSQSHILFDDVWKIIKSFFLKNNYGISEQKHAPAYLILCCFSDCIIPLNLGESPLPLRNVCFFLENTFWEIIQCGLVNKSPISRKRSMYVLKRLLEWCEALDEEFTSSTDCTEALFTWQPSIKFRCKKMWEDFIILLEMMEEKQVHVIKPILSKVDSLIKISSEKDPQNKINLHTSWLVVIFQRMFMHESRVITKWAVLQMLDIDMNVCPILEQGLQKRLLASLFEVLNNSSLYSRNPSDESNIYGCSSVGEALVKFLKLCCSSLREDDKKAQFFNDVLESICQQSWSGVALLYTSYALSLMPSLHSLDQTGLKKIREILLNSFRTQDSLLRGAIQCYLLKAVLKLLNVACLNYEDISKFFIIFKNTECLCRHTSQWNETVSWLNTLSVSPSSETCHFNMNNAKKFCLKSVRSLLNLGSNENICTDSNNLFEKSGILRIARMIMLLADAGIITSQYQSGSYMNCLNWEDLLSPVIETLSTAASRPYMSEQKFDQALHLYISLLNEGNGKFKKTGCTANDHLVMLFLPHAFEIISYIINQKVKNIAEVKKIDQLRLYIEALNSLLEEEKLRPVFLKLVPSLLDYCEQILASKGDVPVFYCLSAWHCLALSCKLLQSLNVNYTETLLKKFYLLIKSLIQTRTIAKQLDKPEAVMCKFEHNEWSLFSSETMAEVWKCIEFYLSSSYYECDEVSQVADLLLWALETGSYKSVHPVLCCMNHILPQLCTSHNELLKECLKMSWNTCLELRKSDLFRPSLKTFVIMAFQSSILTSPVHYYLQKYSSEIFQLSENSSGVMTMLIEHCISVWIDDTNFSSIFNHLDILTESLTFGSICRKDQRIQHDADSFVVSKGESLSVNELVTSDHLSDILVRVHAITFLTRLQPHKSAHQNLACQLVPLLLSKDKELSASKARHFGNSLIHRIKNRIWQAMLLLHPLIHQESSTELLEAIYTQLMSENQQPSVRYIQEWLAVLILYNNPHLQEEFSEIMNQAGEKRPGSIVSFLSILTHLSHILNRNDLEIKMMKWLPLVLSWNMAHNFNTRVYAQVALYKLWQTCNDYKLQTVLDKYGSVCCCLHSAVENGNSARNTKKLLEDFYFFSFHPVQHYSLETVFYELPRLAGVTDEEWIPSSLFEELFDRKKYLEMDFCIPIKNPDSKLHEAKSGSWVLKTASFSSDCGDSETVVIGENFQKKIAPWKQMIPDIEALQDLQPAKKHWTTGGLVVVASLIDRPPNLGGLCRTCEVFGVSEYVIGSLKFAEDKQFQNLSVSADRWITIKEVKPQNLMEYLLEMRKQDYTLIGVEQTDESQSLLDYKFPKKSLLLLGNEKEGLPVELIHLLDICIEIPQQGIVRSLNVHVSGAILIWEYARQHMVENFKT